LLAPLGPLPPAETCKGLLEQKPPPLQVFGCEDDTGQPCAPTFAENVSGFFPQTFSCRMVFRLPNENSSFLSLASTTTIVVNLSEALLQFVTVRIKMEGTQQYDEEGIQIVESTANDTVLAPYNLYQPTPVTLAQTTRIFQTTYVILESDDPKSTWSAVLSSLWQLSQVFEPQDPQTITGTQNLYDYLHTPETGSTFTIQLEKTNYFVFNKEAIVTEVGELILSVVLVIHVCLGLFEVLSAIVEAMEYGYDKIFGDEEEKKKERINLASPRATTSTFELKTPQVRNHHPEHGLENKRDEELVDE